MGFLRFVRVMMIYIHHLLNEKNSFTEFGSFTDDNDNKQIFPNTKIIKNKAKNVFKKFMIIIT